MPVNAIHIAHYRSIRSLELRLDPITTIVGANGTGKSNLYRALRLLHAGAIGRLAEWFAEEGGMASTLYAGPKRRDEIHGVRMSVGVDIDHFTYSLACGLPTPKQTVFTLDPEVKEEDIGVRVGTHKKPIPICERRNHVVTIRNKDGSRETLSDPLDPTESLLTQFSDPRYLPELALVRLTLAGWRFYHQFRTDADAPARKPRLGIRSPVLSEDGGNLATVIQTIRELEHERGHLDAAIAQAFPACALIIESDSRGLMSIAWRQPGIHRSMDARELSDGTLRFLCLAAALLTPRPANFLVLNEPESSLHPNLLPALAQLIATAGERCQVLLTTHSNALAESITAITGRKPITLTLNNSQTQLEGAYKFGTEED